MANRSIAALGALGLAMVAAGAALSSVGPAQAGFDRPVLHVGSDVLPVAVRVVRRTTTYVTTLPKGCVRTQVNNTVLWRCGKTYYQAEGNRYVVVYVE